MHYGEDRHWVCGELGVSEWTLTGTSVSGQRLAVRGVDLLEFAEGKIAQGLVLEDRRMNGGVR